MSDDHVAHPTLPCSSLTRVSSSASDNARPSIVIANGRLAYAVSGLASVTAVSSSVS